MPALTPRVWSSDQPGAPVVQQDVLGSLLNLLDNVLIGVDGKAFDGQDACGWIGTRTNSNLRANYNTSSTYGFGTAVQVYDGNNSGEFAIHCGESYAADFVIQNRCRAASDSQGVTWGFKGGSARPLRWWIVADERNFFLMCDPNATFQYPTNTFDTIPSPGINIVGAGDFIRWDGVPAAFQFGNSSQGSNSSYRNVTSMLNSSNAAWYTSRDIAGAAIPTTITLNLFCNTQTRRRAGSNGGGTLNMTQVAPKGLGLWTNLYAVTDASSTTVPLGYIRGLHLPLTGMIGQDGFKPGATVRGLTTDGPRSLFLMMEASSSAANDWGVIGIEVFKPWDVR